MRYVISFSLLLLALVACAPRAVPAPEESPLAQPQEEESPLMEPSKAPTSPVSPTSPASEIMQAAESYLAEKKGFSPEAIKAISVVPVDWPDASLGCPEPGKAYAQVVTPGYRVILEAEGERYEVHADKAGKSLVICEQQSMEKGPAAAVQYLADELGIAPEEIEVLIVEKTEWPDASLGCPEPEKSYAQVVTAGYQVLLEAQGRRYDVHTDQMGQNVVICNKER